jgi:hypothetical protein
MSHPNATTVSCMACGAAGHHAMRCKSLGIPPDGFYTGGNGGGGHDHDDDEKAATSAARLVMLFGLQNGSEGGGTLSTLREPVPCYHTSPSRPSSVAV